MTLALWQWIVIFATSALVVMVAGTFLARAGDSIATRTRLGGLEEVADEEAGRVVAPAQVDADHVMNAWWVCPNGHEYQATVRSRARGGGHERRPRGSGCRGFPGPGRGGTVSGRGGGRRGRRGRVRVAARVQKAARPPFRVVADRQNSRLPRSWLLLPAPWTLLSGSGPRYWVNLFFSAPLAAVHCYAIVELLTSDASTQTDYIVWLPYYQYIAAVLLANVLVSIVRIRTSKLAASGGRRALSMHTKVAQQ